MSEKIEQKLPLWAETIASLPEFYELVNIAAEICLDMSVDQLRASAYYMESMRRLSFKERSDPGAWALRAALENMQDTPSMQWYDAEALETLRHVSRHPTLPEETTLVPILSGELNELDADDDVTALAEALGAHLLDTAYLCLGDEVQSKISEWKSADYTSRIEIILWLYDVTGQGFTSGSSLELMNDEGKRASDVPMYHPARLSPRLIGTYPEPDLQPTCLGSSIIAASFLHQCGVREIMHGGLVDPTTSLFALHPVRTFMKVLDVAYNEGITIHSDRHESIHAIRQNALTRLLGFDIHAALVFKADPDTWVSLDPYQQTMGVMNMKHVTARKYQEIYELMSSVWDQTPGVELMVRDSDGKMGALVMEVIGLKAEKNLLSVEDWESILDNCTADDFTPITRRITDMFGEEAIKLLKLLYERDRPEGIDEDFLEKLTLAAVRSFIFPDAELVKDPFGAEEAYERYIQALERSDAAAGDEDVIRESIPVVEKPKKMYDYTKCIARYKTDAAYRRRRLEDARLMPLLFAGRIQQDYLNDIVKGRRRYPPHVVELGKLEHRIGMCVLSDFSGALEADIAPSLWLSQWSSHLSWFEAHRTADMSEKQSKIAQLIGRAIGQSIYTYQNVSGILSTFIEHGGNSGPGPERGA